MPLESRLFDGRKSLWMFLWDDADVRDVWDESDGDFSFGVCEALKFRPFRHQETNENIFLKLKVPLFGGTNPLFLR